MIIKLGALYALAILYFSSIFIIVKSGTLKASGENPVSPSITNRNQYSDYVFTFVPETRIPKNGLIVITFPYQYQEGLGIDGTISCSLSCTLNGYKVTLVADKIYAANTEMSLTIYQVYNPTSKGGTGNFQVETYDGVNLLDQNLIFGVIGISDSAGKLTSNIVSFNPTASTKAGDLSSYQFQFKTSTIFPSGSYMKFVFPKGFTGLTTYPTCKAFSVNGYTAQGQLTCVTQGINVIVTGFSDDIPANQYVGIEIAAYNPPYVGITDSFSIYLLRSGTNAVYDLATGISGLTITAGLVSDITFEAVDPNLIKSLLKVQDYRISFRLSNPLSFGNVITVEFPPTITVAPFTGYTQNYIVEGLDDVSPTSTVAFYMGASNVVMITNFQSFVKPQQITLQMRLTNPNNAGLSTALKIRSYTDILMKTLIDEDTTTATITVQGITSGATGCAIANSVVAANILIQNFDFNIYPTVTLPIGQKIVIKIPLEFDLGVINITTCLVKQYGSTVWISPTYCYQNGQFIYIDPDVAFTAYQLNNVRFLNTITTPDRNGSFLFDVTVYADGVTVSESWSNLLVVNPSGWTSVSVTSLAPGQQKFTILTLNMLANFTIPAGITQSKATDLRGVIELEFNILPSYVALNGYTSGQRIPCKPITGLAAITDVVYCKVYPGTSTSIILIENFQTIPAGTAIRIEILRIQNYWSSYQIIFRAVSIYNRIRNFLCVSSFTVPLTGAPALVDSGSSVSNYIFSNNQVSKYTNLTFTPGNTVNLAGPGTIIIQLPTYDTGWIEKYNGITCQLGSTMYTCSSYVMADWILIPMTFIQSFPVGSRVTLYGLKVPRYAAVVGNLIFRYVLSTSPFQEFSYRTQAPFPMPATPTFLGSALTVDKKGTGQIAVTYTFIFSPENDILQDSTIKITFPSNYNLLSTDPPIKISSPDLVSISSANPVSFSNSIFSINVDGFQTIKAGSTFTIIASGVKNPTGATISQYYIAEVLYNNFQLVYHYNFDRFSFTPAATTGFVTFNSITSIPLNANEEATYIIQIVPATAIPSGGLIVLTFPSKQYKQLPSPSCAVSGAIKTFSYCILAGNVYTIQLNTNYATGSINIIIYGITNPDRGTTDGFEAYTSYDGVVLDTTDTSSLVGRTLTTTTSVAPIIMSGDGISFTPQNEGQPADYTFSFVTSNQLDPDMQIYIEFPVEYDALLGPNIACDKTNGLIGTISCTVDNRAVYISGFDTYLPDSTNPIKIIVYGVVNPNFLSGTTTGYFKIGTMQAQSTSFLDYISEAGTVTTVAAPGWAVTYEILPTNLYTRLQADYTYNFTTSASIPRTSSKGAIIVAYPIQFSIDDGTISCDTLITKFAPIISCNSFRNFITINGHTQDYSGNLKFTLRQVDNPTDPGITDQLVLMTFDAVNKRVIERSYRNLDFFSFNYTYPGPLIHIADEKSVSIYAGTQSNDLYITVDYPCALNLTIKPLVPGFSTIPYNMPLTLGMIKTKFRISVPQNFPPGTYYILWETYNDLVPPYYTPIKKTPVIVMSNPGLKIQVPTIFPIPYGGTSLPNYFTVPYAPDTGFDISINFLTSYSGITLDVTGITFAAGLTTVQFSIFSSNDTSVTGGIVISGGSIVLSVSGVNSGIFTLSSTSIDFTVISSMTIAVGLSSISIGDITKNSATLNLVTTEVCMVYWMLALKGTAPPTFAEVANEGPAPYPTTLSIYGSVKIDFSYQTKIYFDELVAQTPYMVYVYLMDRGLHFVGPYHIEFDTLDRFSAAEFTIQFLTGYMSAEDIYKSIKGVAFTLSLPEKKVQRRIYTILKNSRLLHSNETAETNQIAPVQDEDRNLQVVATVQLNLQIVTIAESSVYPSPIDMADILNTRKDELNARLENYDESFEIQPTEFTIYYPVFPRPPVVYLTEYFYTIFKGSLDNYGFIYVVCIMAANDTGTPSPYQIWKGYNNLNIPVSRGYAEISTPYLDFKINVTDLEPLTEYNAYIIGGSAHPGYPDLADDKYIVKLNFITAPAPTSK